MKKALESSRSDDQISNLPDDILCHILSFLPTKYSVRTRVLSKRWKHLFSLVPILDFENSSDEFVTRKVIRGDSFVDCVNSIMFAYKAPKMEKFRLNNNTNFMFEHGDFVSWISIAICCGVVELDIVARCRRQTLPRHVFTSETLTILKIDCNFWIFLPTTVSLPCLKTCHFSRAVIFGDTAQRLFCSCPVLEDLMLAGCEMVRVTDQNKSLKIFGLALERFVLHECGMGFDLALDAPNLLSFEYLGSDWRGRTTEEYLRMLINKVSYVRCLSVNAFLVQAFRHSGNLLPEFFNLTSLTLGLTSAIGFAVLLDFLDRSHQLEVLVISKEVLDQNNHMKENTDSLPEHVPTCVWKHIKEIEFRSFSLSEYDLKLVEYFLKNAKVLDKIKIQTCAEEILEISSKVLAFPRCLSTCEVVFE